MKSAFAILFAFSAAFLFSGCVVYPAGQGQNTMVYVTSTPTGAHVFSASGFEQCGPNFPAWPYKNVQGTYRGETPLSYARDTSEYENVRVVWPDGEDSGWRQHTGFGMDYTFNFVQIPPPFANAPIVAPQSASSAAPSAVDAHPVPQPRFRISIHVEDDQTKGAAILGNGDGVIQKGEAFDLVIIVINSSTSTATSVTCKLTLPTDQSLIAFNELQFTIATLAPAAAATNRINLAMPLGMTITTPPVCRIEVQEIGANMGERSDFVVPMTLP